MKAAAAYFRASTRPPAIHTGVQPESPKLTAVVKSALASLRRKVQEQAAQEQVAAKPDQTTRRVQAQPMRDGKASPANSHEESAAGQQMSNDLFASEKRLRYLLARPIAAKWSKPEQLRIVGVALRTEYDTLADRLPDQELDPAGVLALFANVLGRVAGELGDTVLTGGDVPVELVRRALESDDRHFDEVAWSRVTAAFRAGQAATSKTSD